jgi:hypothetical protein
MVPFAIIGARDAKQHMYEVLVGGSDQCQGTIKLHEGSVFCAADGQVEYSGTYEARFYDALAEVQFRQPDLIPVTVDIPEDYGIARSFRRGSDSEALSQGVSQTDIDAMNRWRTVEKAKGRCPAFGSMQEHYADVRNTALDRSLRNSAAL